MILCWGVSVLGPFLFLESAVRWVSDGAFNLVAGSSEVSTTYPLWAL